MIWLVAVTVAAALTTAQRDRIQFDANAPKKGANQTAYPAASAPTVKDSFTVQSRAEVFPLPPDEDYCPTCVDSQPMTATFTFTVVERAPGAHGGPYAYGLSRSFDGGKTWVPWCRWVNDTFGYNFTQTVALPCSGPMNRLIQVRAWAANQ